MLERRRNPQTPPTAHLDARRIQKAIVTVVMSAGFIVLGVIAVTVLRGCFA